MSHTGDINIHCWWEWKTVQLLWKTVWLLLEKLNTEFPYEPAIQALDMSPEEMKTHVFTKMHT